MSGFLVEARGLELGYGDRVLLRVPSLALGDGQGRVVGFRGPNGAGKSTFLRACLGLHPTMSGELRLLGSRPGSRDFRSVLARVGYAPQARPPGRLRLTVAEAVELGRYGRIGRFRIAGAADRRAVGAALERAGVSDLAGKAVQELSGGQYQRVAVARALAAEPELLVLDEPGSHLDAEGRRAVVELVASVAREGAASMLLVSHDPELLALCDSMIEFRGGLAVESARA
jgi:ABC-type Mn2+/Zn2+ transport system ATPase subunit